MTESTSKQRRAMAHARLLSGSGVVGKGKKKYVAGSMPSGPATEIREPKVPRMPTYNKRTLEKK